MFSVLHSLIKTFGSKHNSATFIDGNFDIDQLLKLFIEPDKILNLSNMKEIEGNCGERPIGFSLISISHNSKLVTNDIKSTFKLGSNIFNLLGIFDKNKHSAYRIIVPVIGQMHSFSVIDSTKQQITAYKFKNITPTMLLYSCENNKNKVVEL